MWLTVQGRSPSRQEGVEVGVRGSWSPDCICSQESKRDADAQLTLLFIQSGPQPMG